jgi:hypothetical protein
MATISEVEANQGLVIRCGPYRIETYLAPGGSGDWCARISYLHDDDFSYHTTAAYQDEFAAIREARNWLIDTGRI